jgi:hypothetical protein
MYILKNSAAAVKNVSKEHKKSLQKQFPAGTF